MKRLITILCLIYTLPASAGDNNYSSIYYDTASDINVIGYNYGSYYEDVIPVVELILEGSTYIGSAKSNDEFGYTNSSLVVGFAFAAGITKKLPILPIRPYAKIGINVLDVVWGDGLNPVLDIGAKIEYYEDLAIWVYLRQYNIWSGFDYDGVSVEHNTVGVGLGYKW